MKILPIQRRPPAGSEELLHRALLTNLDALYATALRLSGGADVAEDAVQETAKKALKAAPPLNDDRSARKWLFRVLINTVRDHFRRRIWEELEPGAEDLEIPPDVEGISRATIHDVRTALAQLKPGARAIILLNDIEGFTLAEAAEILKIPIGTAASRLARARAELRRILSAYDAKSSQSGGEK